MAEEKKAPTHDAFLVNENSDGKAVWSSICPVWEMKDGKMKVDVPDGMLISKPLILIPRKEGGAEA